MTAKAYTGFTVWTRQQKRIPGSRSGHVNKNVCQVSRYSAWGRGVITYEPRIWRDTSLCAECITFTEKDLYVTTIH